MVYAMEALYLGGDESDHWTTPTDRDSFNAAMRTVGNQIGIGAEVEAILTGDSDDDTWPLGWKAVRVSVR